MQRPKITEPNATSDHALKQISAVRPIIVGAGLMLAISTWFLMCSPDGWPLPPLATADQAASNAASQR